MATTLDALKAAVEHNTSVIGSAVTAFQTLATKLQELIDAGSDPAELQALADEINTNADTLAAAVAANTPADPNA